MSEQQKAVTPTEWANLFLETGEATALEAYVAMKRIEAELSEAMGKVKKAAIEEAEKYGRGEHEAYGAVIQKRAGATRWKFDHLPWYSEIEEQRKALAEVAKKREDEAKAAAAARERMQTIVDDDGVVVEPAIPVPGSDTVAIMLKKK
jgi:arginine utilization protein RocB